MDVHPTSEMWFIIRLINIYIYIQYMYIYDHSLVYIYNYIHVIYIITHMMPYITENNYSIYNWGYIRFTKWDAPPSMGVS